MSFSQFFLILRARILVLLTVLITVIVAVWFVTKSMPKQYVTSTAMVVDAKKPDPIVGGMVRTSDSFTNTQVSIINSKRTALKVVEMLGLEQDEAFLERWRKQTKEKIPYLDWVTSDILSGLAVDGSRITDIMTIRYTGTDKELVTRLSDAFAEAYIKVSLELKIGPAKLYTEFFQEQADLARERLEVAQNALTDYMNENGITSTDSRMDFENQKLTAISGQLTDTQGALALMKGQISDKDIATNPEVLQNQLVNTLKAQIAQLEGKLKESRTVYGWKHPQTVAINAEYSNLKKQLKEATDKIISSIRSNYQINKEKERHLKRALEKQKQRVLQLNNQWDRIALLVRDVQTAQQALDALNLKLTQTDLESQSGQTNASILTYATVPQKHSKPNMGMNLFLGGFIGMMLGVALSFLVEFINRRVRSPEDLKINLDIPVIGTVPSSKKMIAQIRKVK